jgi:hypothetical protein
MIKSFKDKEAGSHSRVHYARNMGRVRSCFLGARYIVSHDRLHPYIAAPKPPGPTPREKRPCLAFY